MCGPATVDRLDATNTSATIAHAHPSLRRCGKRGSFATTAGKCPLRAPPRNLKSLSFTAPAPTYMSAA